MAPKDFSGHYPASTKLELWFDSLMERKRLEELLPKQTHDLCERVKELCLYGISKLFEKQGISLEDIVQGIINLIPPAWLYPEITCTRIVLGAQEFRSGNFQETIWKQTSDITVHGERAGSLEVFYLDERPQSDEGPFLKEEERNLIDAIAERLGKVLEKEGLKKALCESEAKYRTLVEQIPVVTYIAPLDDIGTPLYISPQLETPLGFSHGQYRPSSDLWVKGIHPGDRERVMAEVARAQESEEPFESEYRMIGPNGRMLWIRNEAVIVHDDAGSPIYFQGVMLDITGRKRAEEALARELTVNISVAELSKKLITSVSIDEISSLVLEQAKHLTESKFGYAGYVDPQKGNLVFEKFSGLWGLVSNNRKSVLANIPADPGSWVNPSRHVPIRSSIYASAMSSEMLLGQLLVANSDREYTERDLEVLEQLATLYAIAIQRRRAEEEKEKIQSQLFRSQKMETIGRLARGLGHDLKNLMTAVISYSTFLLTSLGKENPMRQDVEEINKAGKLANILLEQLISFSREQVIQPTVVDLNNVISDMEKMLRRLIGEDVVLETELETDLGKVKCDLGQIEQVILNLVLNARDAMPREGKLTIQTGSLFVDEAYSKSNGVVESGIYVMLAVCDTGMGMDEETQSHIFEPFFTTKEQGKGTGLGLSIVYGIVKQCGGHIEVYSEPRRGTTFKIYLPEIKKDVEKG